MDKSIEAWNAQYGERGAEYIQEICKNVDKLKPIINEIGWQVLDINNEGIRIIIEFEKPQADINKVED